MLTLLIFLGFAFLIGLCAIFVLVYMRMRSNKDTRRTTSILSAIAAKEEDFEAEVDFREFESHRHWISRISGLRFILSVIFALFLLFLATFEYWVKYFPEPRLGEEYPVTIRATYNYQESQPRTLLNRHLFSGDNSIVIARGQRIEQSDIVRYREFMARRGYPAPELLLGYFLLFLLFVLFMVYWLSMLTTEIHPEDNRTLIFLLLVILLVVSTSRIFYLTDIISLYYIPVSMIGILVAILVSNRIVPSVVIFADFFIGMMTGFNFRLVMILFAGSMVTVFLSQRIKRRSEVLATGLIAGIIKFVLYGCLLLVTHEIHVETFMDLRGFLSKDSVACLAGGLISGFIALALIPFIEKVFGYASPFRLQELADLDNELLRQLYLKAPGTYHHSMAVANLGEIAANEIGADALLVRVAGYYHDIGKIFTPKYFVENIPPGESNPHDGIKPYMSAKILKSHISRGVELGRRHHLPAKILDFIPQHHGTSTIDYFYEKAKNTANPGSTDPGVLSPRYYSYGGPRPRNRETAILMIADSVEAAARVLTDHSEETLLKAIEKIIARKLELGQFDDSPLSTAELRKIAYALARALSSSSHKRIDYPKNSGIHSQFHSEANGGTGAETQPVPVPATPGISVSGAPFKTSPAETSPGTGPLTPPPRKDGDSAAEGSGKHRKTDKSDKKTE